MPQNGHAQRIKRIASCDTTKPEDRYQCLILTIEVAVAILPGF
jgi:hypothetical protein